MSNRRKLPPPAPHPSLAELAARTQCSDCGSRKTVRRFRGGEWEISVCHEPTCPARTNAALAHSIAEEATRAARATFPALTYVRDGKGSGVVVQGGN